VTDEQWARDLAFRILSELHPAQRDAVEDRHRRMDLLVGRGGGKTTTLKAKYLVEMARLPKASFLYVAPTRTMALELLWDPLKDLCERLGIGGDDAFNETRLTYTMPRTGSKLRLCGGDNRAELDKLRGQPFDGVGVDEVMAFPVKLVEILVQRIIGPRLGERGGWLLLASTPGHVLEGLFYDVTRIGSKLTRPYRERAAPEYAGWTKWSSHRWTLEDGAKYVPAMARLWAEALVEKESNGWSDDNPIWMREYKGQWAADDTENIYKYRAHIDGKPWNQWDPVRTGPMQVAVLPEEFTDWHFGYGMDMGIADPFALEVFAFSPSDPLRQLFHVFEYEKTEMYAKTIAQLLLGEDESSPLGVRPHETPSGIIGATGYPDGMVADLGSTREGGNAQVLELKRVYGLSINAAEKTGKYAAFELFNGHLVDGRIKILKGSKLEQQLASLQWSVNEFGEIRERKGDRNDCADAALYCIRLIGHLFETGNVVQQAKAQQIRRDAADPEPNPVRVDAEFAGLLSESDYSDVDDWGNEL